MDQIIGWETYYRIHPPESLRQDFRMALLTSVITNIAIGSHGKAGAKLSETADYLIDWDYIKEEETPRQSVDEMKAFMLSFASKQNKMIAKQKERNTARARKPKQRK